MGTPCGRTKRQNAIISMWYQTSEFHPLNQRGLDWYREHTQHPSPLWAQPALPECHSSFHESYPYSLEWKNIETVVILFNEFSIILYAWSFQANIANYQLLYICFIVIGWLFSYFLNPGMMLLNFHDSLFESYESLFV